MEPFIGEIRIFAGNFAPRGWAMCDGQVLGISQNDALFSLLGTIYGGDGRSTFGLPDLRGRVPIHYGQAPGGSSNTLGTKGGAETVTVTSADLPSHTHEFHADDSVANTTSPSNAVLVAEFPAPIPFDPFSTSAPNTNMAIGAVAPAGGGHDHSNMQPYLGVNFIIALTGLYPSRN